MLVLHVGSKDKKAKCRTLKNEVGTEYTRIQKKCIYISRLVGRGAGARFFAAVQTDPASWKLHSLGLLREKCLRLQTYAG